MRDLIREALGADDRVPGAVVSVQTFGSLLDFHPHLHMLASWGGFDKSGRFHPMEAVPSEETVSRLFRHKVLKMLLREGAIGQEIVENMLSWNHTGFGADIGPALAPDVSADRPTRTRLETLPAYMVRAPIVAGRISEEEDGSVIYKASRIHPRHGGDSRRFDPLDFIAQIVLHIPDVHEKTVIYYGWYSNRIRARRKRDSALAPALATVGLCCSESRVALNPECSLQLGTPVAARDDSATPSPLPLAVRRAWAAMIKRVYEVDPLICPHCKATMRIVSFIEDEDVIYRILKHLDLLGKDSPVGEVRVRGAPEPPAQSA